MSKIILPQHIAQRIAEENKIAEEKRIAEQRALLHKEQIERLKEKLLEKVSQIEDEESRVKVRKMCNIMLNLNSRIALWESVNWEEAARLISDVLLGEGVQYEIKC